MDSTIILITGASSGIGRAAAIKLAEDGHTVYAGSRNVDRMVDLESFGITPIHLDVTNANLRQKCVEHILCEHGRIDVLFNNAGFGAYGAVEDVDARKAQEQFEVNVFGLAAMLRLVLPGMRTRSSGLVINTSSIAGKIESPMGGWYHATKHAIEALSDSLRLEVEQFGIRVVILEPGIIHTNFYKVAAHNLMNASSAGPYANMAHAMMNTFSKIISRDDAMAGSAPEEVAAKVSEIVRSTNPDTRYSVGKMAKLGLFSRMIMSDRMFDRLITQRMTPPSRN